MELIKEDWGRVVMFSRYDGEEYPSKVYTLDEVVKEESITKKIKRRRL